MDRWMTHVKEQDEAMLERTNQACQILKWRT